MAIATEAGQGPDQTPTNDDAGLGGSADDGSAVDTYSLAISRDRNGTAIDITDTANPADAGPPNPQFTQVRNLGRTMGVGTTRHARAMGADTDGNLVTEYVVVSTDIEHKAVPFAMVEGLRC